tara:strand:- start:237 stop:431 length:195 start_codon:yes stop_codon:yes gene_type:complete
MRVLWNHPVFSGYIPVEFMGTDATCNEAIIKFKDEYEWVQFDTLTCFETGLPLSEALKEKNLAS